VGTLDTLQFILPRVRVDARYEPYTVLSTVHGEFGAGDEKDIETTPLVLSPHQIVSVPGNEGWDSANSCTVPGGTRGLADV